MNDSESIVDFLKRNENLWSNGLKSVSLVAEIDVDSETAMKALKYLGIKYSGHKGEMNYIERCKILREEYPAVFLVSTVNLIAEKYDNGGVWPQLADALNIDNSTTFHIEWGETFLHNLQKFNLPTFSNNKNLKQQYVSRMTLHSGIPTRTINDYFRIISEQMTKDPGITAEDFTAWAQGKISTNTLYNVDVPVRHFIEFGKEFSVDIADRCIELISKLDDSECAVNDIALPPRFIKEAARLIKSGQIKSGASYNIISKTFRPKLILDPHTNVPSLYLPSRKTLYDNSIIWNVAFGNDEVIRISAPSHWPGEPSLERIVPITKPVRQITVDTNDSLFSVKTINFIDGASPMTFFDEAGGMLPKSVDIPSGNVWVLAPGDINDLYADIDLRVITSISLPFGWEGWMLSLVDIDGATYIKHTKSNTERFVKSLSSAKILIDSPLSFVRASTGAPVYTSRPVVILPSDSEWEVTLLAAGSGIELNKIKTVAGDNADSLWGNNNNEFFGEYTIKIRGPLGRGATRTLYIAEGLKESATHTFRDINENGLEVASIKLSTTANTGVEQTVQLDSETAESTVDIASYRFVVSIPYARFSYGMSGVSIHPLTIFIEDICENPSLLYFYTCETTHAYFEVSSNGSVIQKENGLIYRNGSYSFNLAKISETLKNYPYAAITFGDKKTRLVLIRPKSLFDKARLSPDRKEVIFSGCADTAGLNSVFYSLSAPWIAPQTAVVSESRCNIPSDLVDAGSLLIFLQVVDEWAGQEELPIWPSTEQIAIIENKGWYKIGNKEEVVISEFLSGNVKTLPTHIDNIGLLWVIYARTIRLYENRTLVHGDSHLIIKQINKALTRQFSDALVAIAQSPIENRMIPYVLISSGMIWGNINTNNNLVVPEWSIRNSLAATLLSAADHDWSNDELSAAVSVLGETVMNVYYGDDPYRSVGGFGSEVDILDADPSQAAQIIDSLGLVPKGLLDKDSRAKAALSVFTIRKDEHIQWMIDNAATIIENTHALLKKYATKEILDTWEHRLHPDINVGWRGLPTASLSLALLARYASRDNKQTKNFFVVEHQGDYIALRDLARQRDLDKQRNGWAEFAKLAPETVSIDIILAEIMIAGAERERELQNEK